METLQIKSYFFIKFIICRNNIIRNKVAIILKMCEKMLNCSYDFNQNLLNFSALKTIKRLAYRNYVYLYKFGIPFDLNKMCVYVIGTYLLINKKRIN